MNAQQKEDLTQEKFVVFVNGYGLDPIRLTKGMTREEAMDICSKNNMRLLDSGVLEEVLGFHPEYQYFRRIKDHKEEM